MDDRTLEAIHEIAQQDLGVFETAKEEARRSQDAYLAWVQGEGDRIAEQATVDMREQGWLTEGQRLVFVLEDVPGIEVPS